MGRVDIITGTLGKALGGASAAAARKEVVEWLRGGSAHTHFQFTGAASWRLLLKC